VNLRHGRVAYSHTRRVLRENGSTSFAFRFEVERGAPPLIYRPKHITLMERDYTHVLNLKSVLTVPRE
jgi:hypothetical protein